MSDLTQPHRVRIHSQPPRQTRIHLDILLIKEMLLNRYKNQLIAPRKRYSLPRLTDCVSEDLQTGETELTYQGGV